MIYLESERSSQLLFHKIIFGDIAGWVLDAGGLTLRPMSKRQRERMERFDGEVEEERNDEEPSNSDGTEAS